MTATDADADAPDGTRRWAAPYAVVPLVAAGLSAGIAAVDPTRVTVGGVRLLGVVPLAAGIGLVAWTVRTYRRAGETLSPTADPRRLVTAGPLAHTRNPMYLGVVVTVGGVAVLAVSPAVAGYAGALAVVYHVVVVGLEEPKLAAVEGYDDYRERVPRWLPRPWR